MIFWPSLSNPNRIMIIEKFMKNYNREFKKLWNSYRPRRSKIYLICWETVYNQANTRH